MARKTPVPQANREVVLECIHQNCPSCGQKMWSDYDNFRRIRTLKGVVRLTLKVRRCPNLKCEGYHQVYRPESEGRWALPVSPVKVVKMILIFVFKSRFLGQSLVGHGLNRKNEEKVIGDRQKSRPRLRFIANYP